MYPSERSAHKINVCIKPMSALSLKSTNRYFQRNVLKVSVLKLQATECQRAVVDN